MVDELKSFKDTILKSVFTVVAGDEESGRPSALKDMISTLASLAGKGKDEIVQMISREIGQAVAAACKEPLSNALKNRKMRVTIEFVPDDKSVPKTSAKSPKKSSAKKEG